MGASTSAPSTTLIALTTTHMCQCHWFLCLRTLLRHCSGIVLLLFHLEVLFNLSCSFNHIIQGLGSSLKACNASANFWSQLREEVLDLVRFCIGFKQVFDRLQIHCKSANILACPLFHFLILFTSSKALVSSCLHPVKQDGSKAGPQHHISTMVLFIALPLLQQFTLQEHCHPQDTMGILLVCKRLKVENKFTGINPIDMFLHCLAFIHSGILMFHCHFGPDMIMIYFHLIVGPVFRLWCLKS